MADDKAVLREIHWRHLFPWLSIFRAFGIALDIKKLVLGAIGALAMSLGWWLLANVFEAAAPSNARVQAAAAEINHWPWEQDQWKSFAVSSDQRLEALIDESGQALPPASRRDLKAMVRRKQGFDIVGELLHDPFTTLWQIGTNWRFVLKPVHQFVRPFQAVFSRDTGFVATIFTLACGIWAVVVWGFFGGAITRIAAVQFAREEKIGLREAVRFAGSKFLSYGGAPMIPLAFVGFFALLCIAGGALSSIPGFGKIFASVLWFLPMLAGFVMAIILVGWAVGWPLMYSTISVEGSDSFDALSRSFAYVFQRPWNYLFYVLLAAVFGSLCSFFVILFADLIVHTSQWAVAWGGGDGLSTLLKQLVYYAPPASGWGSDVGIEEPGGLSKFAAVCGAIWLYVLFMLLVGFVYSYFWSASTIIYYLLRRDVDNTELQEVFLEGEGMSDDLPAESGPAASPVVTPTAPGGADAG